jgi:hypothetical protein
VAYPVTGLATCHNCRERNHTRLALYVFSIENLLTGEILAVGFCAECANDKDFKNTLNELREACQS